MKVYHFLADFFRFVPIHNGVMNLEDHSLTVRSFSRHRCGEEPLRSVRLLANLRKFYRGENTGIRGVHHTGASFLEMAGAERFELSR